MGARLESLDDSPGFHQLNTEMQTGKAFLFDVECATTIPISKPLLYNELLGNGEDEMTNNNQEQRVEPQSLGQMLRRARREAGLTIHNLGLVAGVPVSQIAKLEHDQVRKPNMAHLASLADPLGLTIFELYRAAGYQTPESISALAPELEQALRDLPDHALLKVERYITELAQEYSGTGSLDLEPVVND